MRGVLSPAPFDLVYFLFYFQGFQVVKFGLMRLELGMELVLARFLLPSVSYSKDIAKALGRPLRLGYDGPIRSFRRALPVHPCHQSLDNYLYDQTLQLI